MEDEDDAEGIMATAEVPVVLRTCSTNYFIGVNLPKFRGCLGLLHKLCSINSTVEQLHKKLEFVEYLFRCSHNSTLFSEAKYVELKTFD